MAAAEVGDDVFDEDPTVNRLEERVAALLGKEAALFVPSGTMSNQIAVKAHTQPGDELLCDANCHIYNYEAGGPAVLSAASPAARVDGDYGILDVTPARGQDPARSTSTWSAPGWSAWRTRTTAAAARSTRWRRSRPSAPGRGSTAWPCTSTAPGCGTPSSPPASRPATWAAALRHRLGLLQQGARRAGRLGPGRAEGLHRQGAPRPQAVRRRHAAGRRPRRGGACTPWTTTSSGWPRTTATPRSSPRPSPTRRGCGWTRRRWRRTSSGSRRRTRAKWRA